MNIEELIKEFEPYLNQKNDLGYFFKLPFWPSADQFEVIEKQKHYSVKMIGLNHVYASDSNRIINSTFEYVEVFFQNNQFCTILSEEIEKGKLNLPIASDYKYDSIRFSFLKNSVTSVVTNIRSNAKIPDQSCEIEFIKKYENGKIVGWQYNGVINNG